MDKSNRNDYEHDGTIDSEFAVYSTTLNRCFYGPTLTLAYGRRDDAERIYYAHHKYDLYPTED